MHPLAAIALPPLQKLGVAAVALVLRYLRAEARFQADNTMSPHWCIENDVTCLPSFLTMSDINIDYHVQFVEKVNSEHDEMYECDK